jgi:hypothetical protein
MTLAIAAPAMRCQAQGGATDLLKGETLQQAGISIGAWGSGEAKSSGDYVYTGSQSIKITTHGRYQGARIILDKPLDLTAEKTDKSAYLQLIYMLPDKNGAGRMGMDSGMQGMMSMMAGRMGGMSGGPGGPGGKGGGGYGGPGSQRGTVTTLKPKPVSNLRLVLVTSDGKRQELMLPLDSAHTEREEWKSVSVPLADIPAVRDSTGQIKEIQVFGDSPAILYLGEIRILRDETPIRVDDLEDVTIAKNDTHTFTASAEAGPTPLKYEWTIQGVKSRDGDKQEVTEAYVVNGEGHTFKHKFVKGGDYLVTLTVSDVFGIKKSGARTMNVHVTLYGEAVVTALRAVTTAYSLLPSAACRRGRPAQRQTHSDRCTAPL